MSLHDLRTFVECVDSLTESEASQALALLAQARETILRKFPAGIRESRGVPGVYRGYHDAAACLECGGKCCQGSPGVAAPEDFEPDLEDNVRAAVLSGKWSICPVRPHEYVVRPSFRPTACCFLRPDGCALLFEERPKQCRMYRPCSGGLCEDEWSMGAATTAWQPHADMLEEIRGEAVGRRL